MQSKIGLYFGSFNPIHIGHMAIANYLVEYTPLKQIWFVVSPQNPLKTKKSLLNEHHRLALVREAIGDDHRFVASDFEFHLPRPSYTVTTLAYLSEKYPAKEFALIMGEDNLKSIHKWKNYEQILSNYDCYIYPRIESPEQAPAEAYTTLPENLLLRIKPTKAPIIEISSTQIRQGLSEGKDLRHFLPPGVARAIDQGSYYK